LRVDTSPQRTEAGHEPAARARGPGAGLVETAPEGPVRDSVVPARQLIPLPHSAHILQRPEKSRQDPIRAKRAGHKPVPLHSVRQDCPRGFGRLKTMAMAPDAPRAALLRRGFVLEYVTLAWNVAGIIILAIAAVSARSVALAGFGLDSLIEIGASAVVIWELSGTGEDRQRRGLRLIGYAFAALAAYLLVQSTVVLATGYHPRHSVLGIAWTSVTAVAMFALAYGKARTGAALGNPVLQTEGRVTLIDGILATAVLLGLTLNAALGWWWADPAAGYVLVFYAAREVREIFFGEPGQGAKGLWLGG
jgi:hypothetical protein